MDRVWLRPLRHARDVPRLPVPTGLRVAAGEGRTPARAHPGRRGRTAGAAPDPAARASVHADADQDRRAVHTRLGRAAPGRDRSGVVEVDADGPIDLNETFRPTQRQVGDRRSPTPEGSGSWWR